jgi:protein tyrosine phosphatase
MTNQANNASPNPVQKLLETLNSITDKPLLMAPVVLMCVVGAIVGIAGGFRFLYEILKMPYQ